MSGSLSFDPKRFPTLNDVLTTEKMGSAEYAVVKLLSQDNEILDDIVFKEGNMEQGHKTFIQGSLPKSYWTGLTRGVVASKSSYLEVTDSCGMMESISVTHDKLREYGDKSGNWRRTQDMDHAMSMTQEMARAVIAGDESINPKQFTGLRPRYDRNDGKNKRYILDALKINGDIDAGDIKMPNGGNLEGKYKNPDDTNAVSDFTDIWLVNWGDGVFGFYPKGMSGGLTVKASQNASWETEENNDGETEHFEVWRTHFKWRMGLVVADYRNAVRIANVHKDLLRTNFDSSAINNGQDLPRLINFAMRRMPSGMVGRPAIYLDQDTETNLDWQLSLSVAQSTLTMGEYGGRDRVKRLKGMPLRQVDVLSELTYKRALSA